MALDAAAVLQNVLQQLQSEPQRYKLFGIWWWPMKAMLKRAGYGPAQLYMLGSYQDPDTAALVPAANLQDTLAAAMEEYGQNARYPHPGGIVEDPDGELVTIFDADAAI
jgi:hypothetical protein